MRQWHLYKGVFDIGQKGNQIIRILYVGPLWGGSTCLQRMQAMQELGHVVLPVDTESDDVRDKQKSFFCRVKRKLLGPSDLAYANSKIISLAGKSDIDVLWLDKALTIRPETLRTVRQLSSQTIIVGYAPDDMAGKHNQSRAFLKGISLYHVFFTTKSYGVKELEALGVPLSIFIGNAFDLNTHRPMIISEEDKKRFGGPVGFIGDYEIERAQSIHYLASHGIPVRIWGSNWKTKCKLSHPNMIIEGKSLWGDEYAKAICSFDINLHFLRKINRDLQTTRSIEIPAAGAFMLAERTNEHLELFAEGKEAEFFSSNEELLRKVHYYLKHEDERKRIARNGRERCLRSGYSNHDRIKEMLAAVEDLRARD